MSDQGLMKIGSSGFRELSLDEIQDVAGGTDVIVVTGKRDEGMYVSGWLQNTGFFGNGVYQNEVPIDGDGGYGSYPAELSPGVFDTDGDGEGDLIVVTSPLSAEELDSLAEATTLLQWEINTILSTAFSFGMAGSSLGSYNQAMITSGVAAAISFPSISETQWNSLWTYLYESGLSAKYGYYPEHGPVYTP